MEQVKEGIYTDGRLGKIVGVKPDQIQYGKWFMPGRLGHAESEDLAARFVEAACQNGGWVGLSVKYIGGQIADEMTMAARQEEMNGAYIKKIWQYQDEMRKRKILSILTISLYPRFVKAPTPPAKPEKQSAPFSVLALLCRMQGADKFHEELHRMLEQRWLEQAVAGEGDSALTVLFPTPELVSRIAS